MKHPAPFLLAAAGLMTAPMVQASESSKSLEVGTPEVVTPEVGQRGSAGKYPYFSLQIGVGLPRDYAGDMPSLSQQTSLDLNTGFNAEAAVGYRFNDFRTDLSVGYGGFGVDRQSISDQGESAVFQGSGTVDLLTVMANVYYDLPIRLKNGELSRWSPYVGGGIGYANVSVPSCVGGCYGSRSDDAFAWQAKLGAAYRATESGTIFFEGGYLGTVNNSGSSAIEFGNFGAWRINLGWRQRFGGVGSSRPAPIPPAAPVAPAVPGQ